MASPEKVLKSFRFRNEGRKTSTSIEQCNCELACFACFTCSTSDFKNALNEDGEILLKRDNHISFALNGFHTLPSGFVSLDCSRPWLIYWILQALCLLECEPTNMFPRLVATLASMQDPRGGFCGGPQQLPHCAPTYASVLALCNIGTDAALSLINREGLYDFFMSNKHSCGGFRMHHDGEVDSRATYTVISIARICNILTEDLIAGVAEYISACQTYEGGFGGEPGNEAHGGYTFCSIATLLILQRFELIDVDLLEHWLVHRQMQFEGGFQGRTNKLVDSCYSFWQGASCAIVKIIRNHGTALYDLDIWKQREEARQQMELSNQDLTDVEDVTKKEGCLSFHQASLQRYILYCAQNISAGGLRDKPGKTRDFYHSCYALSGLSVSQHSYLYSNQACNPNFEEAAFLSNPEAMEHASALKIVEFVEEDSDENALIFGDICNILAPTSVVFNIRFDKLSGALFYFAALPALKATQ